MSPAYRGPAKGSADMSEATAPSAARSSISGVGTARVTYPVGETANVALRGGTIVGIRPVRYADLDAIRSFLGELSGESVFLRFFGMTNLDWAARWCIDVDYVDRYGLIAMADTDGPIIAHGAYIRQDADRAEMAFVVADAYHELGIATVLLRRLAGLARAHGISTLTAVVLPYNRHMTEVFRDSGYPVRFRTVGSETPVEMATSLVDVEAWPGGGWAVRLAGHHTPISRHDTEDEAHAKAASYQRGLERAGVAETVS